MEKPFDAKALAEKLKSKGLPMAEEMAKELVGGVFEWIDESIAIHPSPYAKFLMPVVAQLKPIVMEEVDKIDGQVG